MKPRGSKHRVPACVAAAAILVSPSWVRAQQAATADDAAARLQALKQQVDEQTRQLDSLRKLVSEQEAALKGLQRAVATEVLATQRGGQAGAAGAEPQAAQAAQAPQGAQPAADAKQAEGQGIAPVGQAPAEGENIGPLSVARVLELPGVLTQRGMFVVEPSIAYSYSSSLRVSLVGYSILPALLIGLIDVREIRRNTWTAALRGSYGVTNRFEIEGRVPYIYRSDSGVGREFLEGSAQDVAVFNGSGSGIGDVEFTARYQFNDGGTNKPFYVGSLRFKSRTGTDPFEVMTRSVPGLHGEGIQTDLPTGSGFNGIQPGFTVLYPTDPVVLFGTVNYLYSFARNDVTMRTDQGDRYIGKVAPGGIFGFNFGIGLGLNDKLSLSFAYDQASIAKTKINGVAAPDSVTLQVGTLLIGGSYRLTPTQNLNVTVGVGVTRDAPDVTLSLRYPMSF